MKLFCSSTLLVYLCDGAALSAGPQNHPISRAVVQTFSFLPREIQVKIILHHSAHLDRVLDDEFLHELVLLNAPELDEALVVSLDRRVDAAKRVVQEYIECRQKPYCKYLPRGLRNAQGEAYARQTIAEYMTPDGKNNDDFLRWDMQSFDTCFLDDFFLLRGSNRTSESFQVLAKADKSAIMVSRNNKYAFTIIPSARMLIRVVDSPESYTAVELWHADSIEPQILYDGGADPQFLNVAVEISPNHEKIIVFITYKGVVQTRVHAKKVFNTGYNEHKPVFVGKLSDPKWTLFEDIQKLSCVESHYRVHDQDIFTLLTDRDAKLLDVFRAEVKKIGFPDEASGQHPQQAILRAIHRAINEPDDRLLPLIKELLKGRAYQSSEFAQAIAIESLIRRTIAGDHPLFQLSAQEFWDTSIRG